MNTLTPAQFTAVVERSVDRIKSLDGTTDIWVYKDYSGRGMDGEECIGVAVPSDRTVTLLSAVLTDEIYAEFGSNKMLSQVVEILSSVQADSLGRNTIVYFPSWKYTPAEPQSTEPKKYYVHFARVDSTTVMVDATDESDAVERALEYYSLPPLCAHCSGYGKDVSIDSEGWVPVSEVFPGQTDVEEVE